MNRIKKEVRNAEVNGIEITKELLKEIVSGKQKKYNQSENNLSIITLKNTYQKRGK